MSLIPRSRLSLVLVVLALSAVALASSGDRNPTFQHCLKGCNLTYCDPSQPPISSWLRLFGWTCEDDCRYQCAHSFTDNIRQGSKWHQCESSKVSWTTASCSTAVYGKWPFYRLGPIQEPFSVLMSIGNFFVNLQGLKDLNRRVHHENKLKRWLQLAGYAQLNTWFWSAVFHTRGAWSAIPPRSDES
jgi:post-GPI attachment to proteins factor 3